MGHCFEDLDHAIGLDGNDDGSITWGELRARQDTIATYAISRLRIERGDSPCSIVPAAHLVEEHSDGAYAVLRFVAHCSATDRPLSIGYSLFFDLDPQHRGLLRLDQQVNPSRLSSARPESRMDLRRRLI